MVRKLGIILGICIAAVIAVALFGTMLARPYSEEKLVKKGVIEPDSRFIDVEGVRTRYVEEGEGEKAIIFIHGFSSSLYTWRSCLGPLAKHYRVVALDLKGFGFSGKPETEYTIDRYADFVVHFMDAVHIESLRRACGLFGLCPCMRIDLRVTPEDPHYGEAMTRLASMAKKA